MFQKLKAWFAPGFFFSRISDILLLFIVIFCITSTLLVFWLLFSGVVYTITAKQIISIHQVSVGMLTLVLSVGIGVVTALIKTEWIDKVAKKEQNGNLAEKKSRI